MLEKIKSLFKKDVNVINFVFESNKDNLFLNFNECTDINKSTLRRFWVSPTCSTVCRVFTVINPYPVKILLEPPLTGKYIIPVGVGHSPDEWCGPDIKNNGYSSKYPERKNLFEHIPKKYLKDIQEGRAFLLLDQTHEGYQTSWLWEWFHNNCHTYNISPKNIIYITGNLMCSDQYNEYCEKHNITDKILAVPLAHFEHTIYEISSNFSHPTHRPPGLSKLQRLPTVETHKIYKAPPRFNFKIFNVLQKRSRGHRIWLFYKLVQSGLIDYSIATMNSFSLENTYFEGRVLEQDQYDMISKLLPMIPKENPETYNDENFKSGDGATYVLYLNHMTMLETYCTVVSEASFGESELSCFLSEKTFKPIACQHPFIIAGSKNSLKYLHAMGYKTFDGLIDESYDSLDTWERLDAIMFSMKKIASMTHDQRQKWCNSTSDILKHNYKNLVSRGKTYPDRLLKTLSDWIE